MCLAPNAKFIKIVFYLATADADGQSHVRSFGAVAEFENKLYIVTNNQKDVYRQLLVNPKGEICAMINTNKESLSRMYSIDDNLMTVFHFETVVSPIYSFTGAPTVETL